jgi:hypothetical protein
VELLEHAMKVVERVFLMRLRKMVEIDGMQCGVMPGKGTVDALFMARMLQESYGRKKRKLYMCFVDLEKAFDRVPRKVIEWALRKKAVNERLVGAVVRLYEGAKTKVKAGKGMSEAFNVKVGVHQGSAGCLQIQAQEIPVFFQYFQCTFYVISSTSFAYRYVSSSYHQRLLDRSVTITFIL